MLIECTGIQRDKVYIYKKYLCALEKGINSSMFKQYQTVQRVKERRGVTLLWKVDLEKHTVTVESIIEVSFYKLHSGRFSLAGYRHIGQVAS